MANKHNISDDKVVKLLKSKPGESMQFYANQLGIPLGAVGGYVYRLESEADPSLQVKATTEKQISDAVVKLRNTQSLRWERIGFRLRPVLSAAKVKAVYEAATGTSASESYTGRGRNFSSSPATTTSGSKKTSASKKSGAGRKQAGTSGRRAAAKTTGAKPAGRRKTAAAAGAGRRSPS
jgi:hypothetical protein